jgi:excisionase family DNA binding protein
MNEPIRRPAPSSTSGAPITASSGSNLRSESDQRVDLSEPLLDAKQAAKLLGVPPSTVYQWVRDGRLPCLRLGPRAIRFTRTMLAQWAAEQLDEGRP